LRKKASASDVWIIDRRTVTFQSPRLSVARWDMIWKEPMLPEFRTWFPTQNAVNEMMVEVGRAFTPGEEPDPKVVEVYLGHDAESVQEGIAARG